MSPAESSPPSEPHAGVTAGALLVATSNPGKVGEFARLLAASGVRVVGLGDVPPYPDPAETGLTFEENALIKARAGYLASGLATVADDSGLCVDVLNAMPGVRSARWAGPARDDRANRDLLLAQIDDVPKERRGAHFTCALAFVDQSGNEQVVERSWFGHLTREARGDNGFGYDPIFVADGQTRTSAELDGAEKDLLSHRGQAIRAAIPLIQAALGPVTTDPQPEPPQEAR